jgi:hypothetical protein
MMGTLHLMTLMSGLRLLQFQGDDMPHPAFPRGLIKPKMEVQEIWTNIVVEEIQYLEMSHPMGIGDQWLLRLPNEFEKNATLGLHLLLLPQLLQLLAVAAKTPYQRQRPVVVSVRVVRVANLRLVEAGEGQVDHLARMPMARRERN